LFVRCLLGAVALKKVERGEPVQVVKAAGRERLRLLHVAREVLHKHGSLTVGGGDYVNEKTGEECGEGYVNQNDADQAAQAESHRKFHDRFKQEGEDGRNSYGREDGLQKRYGANNE